MIDEIDDVIEPTKKYLFAGLAEGTKFDFDPALDYVQYTAPLIKGLNSRFTDSKGRNYADARFDNQWVVKV